MSDPSKCCVCGKKIPDKDERPWNYEDPDGVKGKANAHWCCIKELINSFLQEEKYFEEDPVEQPEDYPDESRL